MTDNNNCQCGICFTVDGYPLVLIPCGHSICDICEVKIKDKLCPFCRDKYKNKVPNRALGDILNKDIPIVKNVKRKKSTNIPVGNVNTVVNNTNTVVNSANTVVNSANTAVNSANTAVNNTNAAINYVFKLNCHIINKFNSIIVYFDVCNYKQSFSMESLLNLSGNTNWIRYNQYDKTFHKISKPYITNKYCYVYMPIEKLEMNIIDSIVKMDMSVRLSPFMYLNGDYLNNIYFIQKIGCSLDYIKIWLWNKSTNIYRYNITNYRMPIFGDAKYYINNFNNSQPYIYHKGPIQSKNEYDQLIYHGYVKGKF